MTWQKLFRQKVDRKNRKRQTDCEKMVQGATGNDESVNVDNFVEIGDFSVFSSFFACVFLSKNLQERKFKIKKYWISQ